MIGYYDYSMVLLSYLIAMLASYSAFYFDAQLSTLTGLRKKFWLVIGAMTMGSGIWAMHFIGMRAYVMSVEMTYDLPLTLASWVAAVFASGVALHILGSARKGIWVIAASSIAMGLGITTMHYVGMLAMKFSPTISYDPLLFAVSVVIAVVASAAALAICQFLRTLSGTESVIYEFIAAMIMGAAICGMHYTGMAAVIIPRNAMPAPDNLLSGDWLGMPLGLVSGTLIIMALVSSIIDVKRRQGKDNSRLLEAERLELITFYDKSTGLLNRAGMEKTLVDTIYKNRSTNRKFGIIYFNISNSNKIINELGASEFEGLIKKILSKISSLLTSDITLSRYSNNAFVLIINDLAGKNHQTFCDKFRALDSYIQIAGTKVYLEWQAGQSEYPVSGQSSHALLKFAMNTDGIKNIKGFDDEEMIDQNVDSPRLSTS